MGEENMNYQVILSNEAMRELKYYEYRVKATPEFMSQIEECWEVVNVFTGWLPSGYLNYYIVFRRQVPREKIGHAPVPPREGVN